MVDVEASERPCWVGGLHAELALLCAEELIIYRQRRHCFNPTRWRRLDKIEPVDWYHWFGLYADDLRRLFIAWRIPDEIRAPRSRHIYDGEACFIIYLYHLIKGSPFTTMARHVLEGEPRRMSEIFECVVNHVYATFYNNISGTSLDQWIPRYVHR